MPFLNNSSVYMNPQTNMIHPQGNQWMNFMGGQDFSSVGRPQQGPQLIGPQQQTAQVPRDQSMFGQTMAGIGKAFGNFSKALETPGFLQTFLGSIGQALGGQDTWQGRLGGAMTQIGRQTGAGAAGQKLAQGQELNPIEASFLPPDAGITFPQAQAKTDLMKAQTAGIIPAEQQLELEAGQSALKAQTEQMKAEMNALNKLLAPPDVERIPTGEGVEAGGYMKLNPQTMQYEWQEIGSGRTKGFGEDGIGGLSPSEQLSQQRFQFSVYQQANKEAMTDPRVLQYGKIRTNPLTGETTIDFVDPVRGPQMFRQVLNEKIQGFIKNPAVGLPQSYLQQQGQTQDINVQWPE